MTISTILSIVAGILVILGMLFLSVIHLFMIPKDVMKRETTEREPRNGETPMSDPGTDPPAYPGTDPAPVTPTVPDRPQPPAPIPDTDSQPYPEPEPEIQNLPDPQPEIQRPPGR